MSKFTRLQKILMSVIVVLLVLALSTNGKTSSVKGLIFDPLMMLKYSVLDYPVQTVQNWVSDLNRLWQVQQENDELRHLLSEQELLSATNDELKRENAELKELMGVHVNRNFEKVYAQIISRDPEVWNNSCVLNVGSNDGIEVDSAVISSKGLIGKIVEVGPTTSKVRLLTTQNQLSKVAVKISVSDTLALEGYLEQYDLKKASYQVRLFTNNDTIKAGMDVVTSGVGGVFPSGILVGKVNEVEELVNETGKIVYASCAADFSSFEYVAVLKEVVQ